GAAVEAATGRWPVLVYHAAPLAQVSASSICAPLEHQFAVVVPFRQQVGKAAPIALFVDRDACIVAAGRAAGARDRASLAAPPGPEKVACGAVHRALNLIQCSSLPYDRRAKPGSRRDRRLPSGDGADFSRSPAPDRNAYCSLRQTRAATHW